MDGNRVHTLQGRIQVCQKRTMELLVDAGDHDGSKARLDKQKTAMEMYLC